MQALTPSVTMFLNVKSPLVALKEAKSTVAPPVNRVWMNGGVTQEVLVKDVIRGKLTLGINLSKNMTGAQNFLL